MSTSPPVFENSNADPDGHVRRPVSSFRDKIDPSGRFPPEKGRYHLYVSYGCPWAHRTLIVHALKGLEDVISVSIVSPRLEGNRKWRFAKLDPFPGSTDDPLYDATYLSEIYMAVAPTYNGRFTVPVLFDKKLKTIVNNESSEIIRMFYHAFDEFLPEDSKKRSLDLLPKHLESEIDKLNSWVYTTVNDGVYKAGFATTQEAYELAVFPLFESLDRLESILEDGDKTYLLGEQLTEADVRLYTTIVRFDVAYCTHFKCNIKSIRHNYPHLNRWLKNLYWNVDGFKSTTRFDHIKTGYFWSHTVNNPTRIVPVGPIPEVEPL